MAKRKKLGMNKIRKHIVGVKIGCAVMTLNTTSLSPIL